MITPELINDLKREEGFRPHAYLCSEGFWTVGYGTLVDERKGGGITKEEAEYLLRNRVSQIEGILGNRISFWPELSPKRQDALIQMAYQLGVHGLMEFRKMLTALGNRDYGTAADEALRSRWHDQTPARAYRVSQMIRTGD